MKIEELQENLFALNKEINSILKKCDYKSSFKPDTDYDEANPDEYMMYHTFSDITTLLYYVNLMLTYLQKPIGAEGIITKSKRGNYRLNRTILKRGDCIEVFRPEEYEDEEEARCYWDLILVGDIYNLEGLQARLRK